MTTWMDVEGLMLSEISQTEKDKYHIISLICGFENKHHTHTKTNKQKAKLIQRRVRWLPERSKGTNFQL